MRILLLFLLSFFFNLPIQAEHQNEPYEPHNWDKFLVNGSDNYYKFQSELVEDKDVKKEIRNSQNTGLISYLLFEDNKIKIDESNLPVYINSNNYVYLNSCCSCRNDTTTTSTTGHVSKYFIPTTPL